MRSVWHSTLQAYCTSEVGEPESEQRCQLGAVRQMLRMRDECDQAGAKAAWVMDALLRLRHIKGDESVALENDLEDELRRLQRASLREMGTFAVNIAIPAERDRIIEMFSEMDFCTALKSFALLAGSPKMDDLKAEALKQGQKSPLSLMMGIKHIDDEGKTVVNTAEAGRGEPPDDWYLGAIARAESLRRAMIAANYIEPVRLLINDGSRSRSGILTRSSGNQPSCPSCKRPYTRLGLLGSSKVIFRRRRIC